jgi:hypothetical protein
MNCVLKIIYSEIKSANYIYNFDKKPEIGGIKLIDIISEFYKKGEIILLGKEVNVAPDYIFDIPNGKFGVKKYMYNVSSLSDLRIIYKNGCY